MALSKVKHQPARPASDPAASRAQRIETNFVSARRAGWRTLAETDLDAAPDSPDLYKAALSDPRRH